MRTLGAREIWSKSCSSGLMLMLALGTIFIPMEKMGASPTPAASAPAATGVPSFPAGAPTSPVPHVASPRRASRAPSKAPPAEIFAGLGAWLDVYDYGLNVASTIGKMRSAGVRTLYLQTGRSNTARGIDVRVGRWLKAAHRADIKVVGWYLPFYADLDRDLARTSAIARAVFGGERFDGLGVDIEYRDAVPSRGRWNRRVGAHLALVRKAVGSSYPVAAITPTPLQMQVAREYWAGFPWKKLARHSDAILLMSYWSDRAGCPRIALHCAYEFTKANVALTRVATGRDDLVVHVIGGVGSDVTTSEIAGFVRGAREAKADGASIYDIATTRFAWWKRLRALRTLGEGATSG